MGDEANVETLDLALSRVDDHFKNGYVRIGVLPEDAGGPDGTISLVIVNFWKTFVKSQGTVNFAQANLTESEIDQVIVGLQEAKRRMMEYKEVRT